MKVVRLPSGPLACVYSLEEGEGERESLPHSSGTFRAHSGSLHADGASEDDAIAELDEQVRRVSVPPPEPYTPAPSSEPTVRVPDQSQWAMRVRKCGPQDSTPDAETPFDGVTIPPPYSAAPKAHDR